jgi:hypothetical protein
VIFEFGPPQLAAGSMLDDFAELLDGWFIYLIEDGSLNAFVNYGDSTNCKGVSGNYIASREPLDAPPALQS